MANQPVKKKFDYEKYFSNELKGLLRYIGSEVVEDIPFTSLTFDIFFISALNQHDCMLYKAMNGFLTSSSIDEIHDKVYEMVTDKASIPVRPGSTIDYSLEMRSIFMTANDIRNELESNVITSDMVLLAFIMGSSDKDPIKKLLNDAGITETTMKALVRKLKDTVNVISSMTDEEYETFGNRYFYGMDPGSEEGDQAASVVIMGHGTFDDINDVIKELTGATPKTRRAIKNGKKRQIEFCENLNLLAERGEIEPVIGRDKEILEISKVFSRKMCNNVVLVGEPGVGKTTIITGLAKRIVEGSSPSILKNCEIFRLDVGEMEAGTQYRGQFEERVANLISSLKKASSPILFIDGIHNFVNEKKNGEIDLFGSLDPLFQDGDVKVVATTTQKGFHSSFEGNPDVMRRFQKITVESPNKEECFEIVRGVADIFSQFHGVNYDDEIIKSAISLADRYITDRKLPSSAIDILDEAGALKKISHFEPEEMYKKRLEIAKLKKKKELAIAKDDMVQSEDIEADINGITLDISEMLDEIERNDKENGLPHVDLDDMYRAVSEHTGIPVSKVNVSEKQQLSKIDKILMENIVGQDEAIDIISRAIKRNKVGLAQADKPILSCMCIGNTGCGKTLLAKMLAKEIFGDEKYLVRFDMSEYSDKTAVNKLIGASAGYVGYNEGGLLTEAIKNKKHAVLLIDEIEKATDEIYNIFLQILDEGFLTDNTGYKVDFKNTILIMTSNVGAKRAANEKPLGFNVDVNSDKRDVIEKELKNKFPPEFLNRLDEIVYFNSLSDDNLKSIIKLELKKLSQRLSNIKCSLSYTDDVVDYLFKKIEPEKEYGARPIGRAIRKDIENKITDIILENDYDSKEFLISVDEKTNEIVIQ